MGSVSLMSAKPFCPPFQSLRPRRLLPPCLTSESCSDGRRGSRVAQVMWLTPYDERALGPAESIGLAVLGSSGVFFCWLQISLRLDDKVMKARILFYFCKGRIE